jgi:mannose-6-phosphate isomerase
MTIDAALLRPWRLPPNRVARFYRGGSLLEAFRGDRDPADSDRPEDWVGSATPAWTAPGSQAASEGLADAEIDGQRHRIADLLAADPVALVGPDLLAVAGPTLGVLVKLLDAGVRLPVHAHPDRGFARHRLGSYFGKAEAWVVVATRDTGDPVGPGVWLGFRRGLSREELLRRIEARDTAALLRAMHHRPTGTGDVWFVPPATPHAIGAGVFIVEVQEPSDFSILAETRDLPIDPEDAHLRLGWEVAVDALDREGHDEAWVDDLRHDGRREPLRGEGWEREPLTAAPADPFFRAERVTIRGQAAPRWASASWLIGVVMSGQGLVTAGGGSLVVRRGDTFAVPAAVSQDVAFHTTSELELLACRPPDAADLDRWMP